MREGEGGEWWGFERANWAIERGRRAAATRPRRRRVDERVASLVGAPEASTEGIEARGEVSAVSDGAGHLEYLEHVRGVALRLRRRLLRGECRPARIRRPRRCRRRRRATRHPRQPRVGTRRRRRRRAPEARRHGRHRALARTRRWRARVRDRRRGRRRATGGAPAREADVRVRMWTDLTDLRRRDPRRTPRRERRTPGASMQTPDCGACARERGRRPARRRVRRLSQRHDRKSNNCCGRTGRPPRLPAKKRRRARALGQRDGVVPAYAPARGPRIFARVSPNAPSSAPVRDWTPRRRRLAPPVSR